PWGRCRGRGGPPATGGRRRRRCRLRSWPVPRSLSWPYVLRLRVRAWGRGESLAPYCLGERTVSGLFGEHHPVQGQGPLPPFSRGGVGRAAQLDEGGGEGAAGV